MPATGTGAMASVPRMEAWRCLVGGDFMSKWNWIKTAAKVGTGGMSSLYLYGGLLIVGASAATGAYLWHGWKVDGVHDAAFKAGRKEAEYEHQTALLEGLREGTRQTSHLQGVKDAAIAEAKTRADANAADASRARTELDLMRKQAAAGASGAGATHAACTQYAIAATDVLNECGGALQSLAATADGHVNDIRTLTGAWPQWDKHAALSAPTRPTSPTPPAKP